MSEQQIQKLEFELAEAGTDILDLRNQLAGARADCAATSYKLSEAFDELVAYELQLAGARAEIERQTDRIMSDACIISAAALAIAERDKLIEQMREALRAWMRTPNIPIREAIKLSEAALEAAERV